MAFCQAFMAYIVRDGLEVRRGKAVCVLPVGHDGNHRTYVPGDHRPREFPRE